MLNKVRERVRELLEKRTSTRDSDSELIARVWAKEHAQKEGRPLTEDEKGIFKKLSRGEFSSAESITRCRRKWQETEPSLRGEKYDERQAELQPQVRQEIMGWK